MLSSDCEYMQTNDHYTFILIFSVHCQQESQPVVFWTLIKNVFTHFNLHITVPGTRDLESVAEKVLHSHEGIMRKFGIFSARQIAEMCLPLLK